MEEYKCPGCKQLNYTSLTFGTVSCAYCGCRLILENARCRLAGREEERKTKRTNVFVQASLRSSLPYLRLIKNKINK